MAYLPSYLDFALRDDEISVHQKDQEFIFRRRKLSDLDISTRAIVACDPLAYPDPTPYTQSVPIGRFPVYVSIAHINDDQRVGFAAVIFNPDSVVRWEMARTQTQDLRKLSSDGYFGYPVDAGTGCFMDTMAAGILNGSDAEKYSNTLLAELDKVQINTWAWANLQLSPNPPANVVVFSTGYGDGSYPSYFGLGPNGAPVCLVTDFMLIYDESGLSPTLPAKKSWMFWKK